MKAKIKKPGTRPASSKMSQGRNKGDSIINSASNHSASAQRQRVLKLLKERGSATTIEFRYDIDVLHPAARIMELRKCGHNIVTTWTHAENPGGTTHRIGRYTLMPGNHQEAA